MFKYIYLWIRDRHKLMQAIQLYVVRVTCWITGIVCAGVARGDRPWSGGQHGVDLDVHMCNVGWVLHHFDAIHLRIPYRWVLHHCDATVGIPISIHWIGGRRRWGPATHRVTCIHAYIYIYTYAHIHTYCKYVRWYTHAYICMHAHAHTHINKHSS